MASERIQRRMGGGKIVVSPLPRDLVAPSGEVEVTARGPVVLKGLGGEQVMYGVGWA